MVERWCGFRELVGETLTSITGAKAGSDEIIFHTLSGRVFRMWHAQSCCESVLLEDVCGDVSLLLGSPVLLATEESNHEMPAGWDPEYEPESFTWTFYNIATMHGHITLRWLGESNGYYSESVDFDEVTDE